MKLEWKEMEAFVADCINSPRLYIKNGLLEPVHLQEVERKILVENMQESLQKCIQEVKNSQKMYIDQVNRSSERLLEQEEAIKQLASDFHKLTEEKPWIF